MRKLRYILGIVLASAMVATSVFAFARPASAQQTVSATVTANVPSRTSLTLERDSNSVTRFSPTQVVFDRYDDQDPQVNNPNPAYMYAPYRSETGKNWHLTRIVANGASMNLSASVSGSVGTSPLASILYVVCGGFWEPDPQNPGQSRLVSTPECSGSSNPEWIQLSTFRTSLSRPFFGIAPFNYRLTVRGVTAGAYTGQITYTLTST